MALAILALALPAHADGSPRQVLDAVLRLPPATSIEAVLRSAPCAFDGSAHHLGRLPSAIPWAQPEAIVVMGGLPGQDGQARAVVMRPTREMLARRATRDLMAQNDIRPLDHALSPLPDDAPEAAFLAIFVPGPPDEPTTCTPQGSS